MQLKVNTAYANYDNVMFHQIDDEVFEEEFVRVDHGMIHIRLYYFPFGDTTIKASDVKKLKYAKQSETYSKNWGSSGFTWWACDMKRNFRTEASSWYNVSLDTGATFKKGFTVRDITGFLRALRNHLQGCEYGKLNALV